MIVGTAHSRHIYTKWGLQVRARRFTLRLRALPRYSLASASAFLLDIALTSALSMALLPLNLNFLVTGLLVTGYLFFVNSKWVFASNQIKWQREVPRFALVSALNVLVAQLLLLLVGHIDADYLRETHAGAIRAMVLFLLAMGKFVLLDKYVFRERSLK